MYLDIYCIFICVVLISSLKLYAQNFEGKDTFFY